MYPERSLGVNVIFLLIKHFIIKLINIINIPEIKKVRLYVLNNNTLFLIINAKIIIINNIKNINTYIILSSKLLNHK